MKKRHQQKLIVLAFFLFVALNIPILLLFDSNHQFMGLPLIYVYLFSVWVLSVVISLVIVNRYYE